MATTSRHQQAKDTLHALRLVCEDGDIKLEHIRHPAQELQPYWQSADLQVVPNESFERPDAFENHQIVIFTRHAGAVGWVLFFIRDALGSYVSADNKSLVFGQIGLALRRAQAGASPDQIAPLLRAAVLAAEDILEAAAQATRQHRRRRR